MLLIRRYLAVGLLLCGLTSPDSSLAADHAVLFVGNSYTGANFPNLADTYRELIAEGMSQWSDVSIEAVSPGGLSLTQHYQQANLLGTNINGYLTNNNSAHMWDFVVLQDQSQIPSLPASEASYQDSLAGAIGLAGLIDARGAQTRLFQTWGRRNGDPQNAALSPDYPTMQERLDDGYEGYRAGIISAGLDAEIIPVGGGWRLIYEEAVAQGADPTQPSQLFYRLYNPDGSHPSALGTYLTACTMYAFITGNSPVGLTWSPPAINQQDLLALQQTAERLLQLASGDDDDVGDDDDDVGDDDDDVGDDDDSQGDDDDSAQGNDDDSAGDDDDSASDDDDDADGDDDSAQDNDDDSAAEDDDDDDGDRRTTRNNRREQSCNCSQSNRASQSFALTLLVPLLLMRRRR